MYLERHKPGSDLEGLKDRVQTDRISYISTTGTNDAPNFAWWVQNHTRTKRLDQGAPGHGPSPLCLGCLQMEKASEVPSDIAVCCASTGLQLSF